MSRILDGNLFVVEHPKGSSSPMNRWGPILPRNLPQRGQRIFARRFIARAASPELPQRSPLAFAFDIDGVLLQGPNVLPEARRALEFLEGKNPLNIRIPYILMTNGGGVTEAERCTKLSRQLGFDILPSQLVQAHTILRKLRHKYADKPVLILGGKLGKGREVAESYGFSKAYTTLDILAWDKSIWPFHELTDIEKASTKQEDFSKVPFEAIIVIHDPRDWALDVQICVDILRSRKKICREPYKPDSELGNGTENDVDLIFCNPDLLWKSDYPNVRFGQGAFKEALQAVLKATTGKEYPYTQYGKPHTPTYKFAGDVLIARIAELEGPSQTAMPPIFMVGDNPASDIAGANGASWKSVLVHTGVYDPTQGPPAHRPTVEARNVEAAVHWAFKEVTQYPL